MQTGINRRSPAEQQDRMSRLFEQAFGGFFVPSQATEEVSNRNWLPAVDIGETTDSLTLYAELPGLAKEDVDITLEGNVLTLRGERKFEKDTKERTFHRVERSYGAFARSFTLPTNVRTDACQATFQNGVLKVEIPKVDEAKPRKIDIS